MYFAGQSLVADPIGNTLIKAGAIDEILYCDLDLKQSVLYGTRDPISDYAGLNFISKSCLSINSAI